MKNAIATVEIFASRPPVVAGQGAERARRLTLVISMPERKKGAGSPEAGPDAWSCRVALADLHRPETVHAPDSILVLVRALERARGWLAELEAQGFTLARDREGSQAFVLE